MAVSDELLRLLAEAARTVSGYSKMNLYCPFDSGAEFATELWSLRERIAQNDMSAWELLIGIFAPSGAWDDGVGPEGRELADLILAALKLVRDCAGPGAAANPDSKVVSPQ